MVCSKEEGKGAAQTFLLYNPCRTENGLFGFTMRLAKVSKVVRGKEARSIDDGNGDDRNMGIGVDVHVHRIANRLGWCRTEGPEETRLVRGLESEFFLSWSHLFFPPRRMIELAILATKRTLA